MSKPCCYKFKNRAFFMSIATHQISRVSFLAVARDVRAQSPRDVGTRRLSSFARRLVSVACAALMVVALACAAQAQSGRRVQKQKEIAPVPQPSPEPEAKKSAPEPTQTFNLLVLADNTYSMSGSTTAQQTVQQAFMQRLHESPSLVIATDSARTTRGGASKRAKDERERFVVWIGLRASGMNNDPAGIRRPRPEDYYIEYAVYEPVTGKTRAAGNVYLRPGYGSVGGVVVGAPSCYPAVFANEYEFIFGAIDAANRVMKSLYLPLPPICGGA
jgi:hypothetical protein